MVKEKKQHFADLKTKIREHLYVRSFKLCVCSILFGLVGEGFLHGFGIALNTLMPEDYRKKEKRWNEMDWSSDFAFLGNL